MADLDTPPTLPNAYVAQNAQASDQAAYDAAMARVGSQQTPQAAAQLQQAPAAQLNQPQSADQESMMSTEVSRFTSPVQKPKKYGSPVPAVPSVQSAPSAETPTPEGPGTMPGVKSPYSGDAALGYLKQIPDTLSHTFDSPLDFVAAPVGAVGSLLMAAGTGQIPRGIYMGAHDAVKSVFQLADDLDDWSSKKLDDWHLSALNAAIGHDRAAGLLSGYHLLSGQEAEAAKAAGTASEFSSADVVSKVTNPLDIQEPRSVVGIVVKNASQFITGMMFAGKQLQALSMPTNLAGWVGRGVTAAQGFGDGEHVALSPTDAIARFLAATRALEPEAAFRSLGLKPAPAGVRHFLPPVDEAAMRDPPRLSPEWETEHGDGWALRWLFEGFSFENMSRYVWVVSEGSCLTPDLPKRELGFYDPEMTVRHGDVAGIQVEMPGRDPYPCVKHIQEREGKLWACSNDGDLPLSERTRVVGRLVVVLTPKSGAAL